MTASCEFCNDTGRIGVSTITMKYKCPGPVPEDAKKILEIHCNYCKTGWGMLRREIAEKEEVLKLRRAQK